MTKRIAARCRIVDWEGEPPMPPPAETLGLGQPDETLTAVIRLLLGSDVAPVVLTAEAGGADAPSPLPDDWPRRLLTDTLTRRDGRGEPLVLVPRWEARPFNERLSLLVSDVRLGVDLGLRMLVLLPSSELESARNDELRGLLAGGGLSAIVRVQVPGVHASFVAAAVLLEPDACECIRYFDAYGAARTGSVDDITRELGGLLRMKGGVTEHGYVLRDAPDPRNLSLRHNDPRLVQSRAALAAYGDAVPLSDLFDFVTPVHATQARRAPVVGTFELARVLTGSDLRFGQIVEPDEDAANLPASPETLLQVGDLVMRSIVALGSPWGLNCAAVDAEDLPAVASHSLLALRPKPTTPGPVVSFVAAYLSSPAAVDLAQSSQLGGHLRVGPAQLAAMTVPTPDQAMQLAVADLAHARDVAGQWQAHAARELASLFSDASPSANRARVLASSRTLRQKIAAAELTEDFAARVRTRYPLPIAARWRAAQAESSAGPSLGAYESILELGEVLLSYLACMALALSWHCGLELTSRQMIRDKFTRGQGPTLGNWVDVLQELAGKKARPLADLVGHDQLNRFADNIAVTPVVRRLRERRNDHAHGRKVDSTELPHSCREALDDLERLLAAAAFLEDLPLLLVDELDWDALTSTGTLGVRSLVGDHPAVPRTHMSVSGLEFERGSLYVPDATGTLLLLRPFVIASTCETCRTLSTFHVDAPREGEVRYKSFEHGHPEGGERQRGALSTVGLLPINE